MPVLPDDKLAAAYVQRLYEWDMRRGRAGQKVLGISELMGCARYVAHRLRGDAPCNSGEELLRALVGTALHEVWLPVLAPGGQVERRVILFGTDMTGGTLDAFYADGILLDLKTGSSKGIEYVREHGERPENVAQVTGYAEALTQAGETVREIHILHIPVDGFARDVYVWRRPYHPGDGAANLARIEERLASIRATLDAGELPAPERPAGPFCAPYCRFYGTLCPGMTKPGRKDPTRELPPEAAVAAETLAGTRAQIKALEAQAKALTDELRPHGWGETDAVRLSWRVVPDSEEPDVAQLIADFEMRGEPVPMKPKRGHVAALVTSLVKPEDE